MSDSPAPAQDRPQAPAADDAAGFAVVLAKLPPQLRDLVSVMGEGPAFLVVKWRGGTRYTWPKSSGSAQYAELQAVVGTEAADKAVYWLGGQTWGLPKYDSVLRQLRHARVVELRRVQGLSNPEVALLTGYTVRQVITICQAAGLPQPEAADPARRAFLAAQRDLFDADPAAPGEGPAPRG